MEKGKCRTCGGYKRLVVETPCRSCCGTGHECAPCKGDGVVVEYLECWECKPKALPAKPLGGAPA